MSRILQHFLGCLFYVRKCNVRYRDMKVSFYVEIIIIGVKKYCFTGALFVVTYYEQHAPLCVWVIFNLTRNNAYTIRYSLSYSYSYLFITLRYYNKYFYFIICYCFALRGGSLSQFLLNFRFWIIIMKMNLLKHNYTVIYLKEKHWFL